MRPVNFGWFLPKHRLSRIIILKVHSTRARPIKSTLSPIWNEKLWLPLTDTSQKEESLQVDQYLHLKIAQIYISVSLGQMFQ